MNYRDITDYGFEFVTESQDGKLTNCYERYIKTADNYSLWTAVKPFTGDFVLYISKDDKFTTVQSEINPLGNNLKKFMEELDNAINLVMCNYVCVN